MSRRLLGVALLVAALVLAVAALVIWQGDSDDAEKAQLAEEYRAAIDGDAPVDQDDPSRAGPVALGAMAAVAALGGLIVLVIPARDS